MTSINPEIYEQRFIIHDGDCVEHLQTIPNNSVKMVFSSPPYNIGKIYEKRTSLDIYLSEQEYVIRELNRVIQPGGYICWQVGNFVKNGSIIPLDLKFHAIFTKLGFSLVSRFAWTFGHGFHCKYRFSGRYETISVYGKKPESYISRIRSSVIDIEWKQRRLDIPNVKSNHVEKTVHPCQFHVELVERFILMYSSPGDTILDPYCGVGSTPLAAVMHNRKGIGIENTSNYVHIALRRYRDLCNGTLALRTMGTPIHVPTSTDTTAIKPSSWDGTVNTSLKTEYYFDGVCVPSTIQNYQFIDNCNLVIVACRDKGVCMQALSLINSYPIGSKSICFITGHENGHFDGRDTMIIDMLSLPLRNRILAWSKDEPYSSILWFADVDYYFDLDAVRVPAKYPGKKSTRTGQFSGNPLGKNPSDCWIDSDTDGVRFFGMSVTYWKRLVRALCPVASKALMITDEIDTSYIWCNEIVSIHRTPVTFFMD